ncbi:hypothetical protein EPA93_11280 [Ktedonosporobacter rubrisoli]|uniref:RNA polymerase sigma-70 region 4 domain-containing protein n=1 Tax=Ktedonosporobacter rubrisoli TaxID=2509675 RepID=A0A4P6JN86_KTERU|nr:hypothetical protein [Ktedonosporobacter rubrisoli]QBD76550.1 hypothetical protein EPA93_11280 [Ktedonosporobacter rubrisoli]
MLTPDERERIRRAYHFDHKSIRQIAHEEQRSREAIKQALEDAPSAPILFLVLAWLLSLDPTKRG